MILIRYWSPICGVLEIDWYPTQNLSSQEATSIEADIQVLKPYCFLPSQKSACFNYLARNKSTIIFKITGEIAHDTESDPQSCERIERPQLLWTIVYCEPLICQDDLNTISTEGLKISVRQCSLREKFLDYLQVIHKKKTLLSIRRARKTFWKISK